MKDGRVALRVDIGSRGLARNQRVSSECILWTPISPSWGSSSELSLERRDPSLEFHTRRPSTPALTEVPCCCCCYHCCHSATAAATAHCYCYCHRHCHCHCHCFCYCCYTTATAAAAPPPITTTATAASSTATTAAATTTTTTTTTTPPLAATAAAAAFCKPSKTLITFQPTQGSKKTKMTVPDF